MSNNRCKMSNRILGRVLIVVMLLTSAYIPCSFSVTTHAESVALPCRVGEKIVNATFIESPLTAEYGQVFQSVISSWVSQFGLSYTFVEGVGYCLNGKIARVTPKTYSKHISQTVPKIGATNGETITIDETLYIEIQEGTLFVRSDYNDDVLLPEEGFQAYMSDGSIDLGLYVVDEYDVRQTDISVECSLDEWQSVATVSGNGSVNFLKPGRVYISYDSEESEYYSEVSGVIDLNIVDDLPGVKSVSIIARGLMVIQGEELSFQADVEAVNGASEEVTWSVSGKSSTSTNIDSHGLLVVGENETAQTLTVKATSVFDPTKYDSITIDVLEGENSTPPPENKTYTVSCTCLPLVGGTVYGTGRRQGSCILTAQAASGYHFVGWSTTELKGEIFSTELVYMIEKLDRDYYLYALFEKDPEPYQSPSVPIDSNDPVTPEPTATATVESQISVPSFTIRKKSGAKAIIVKWSRAKNAIGYQIASNTPSANKIKIQATISKKGAGSKIFKYIKKKKTYKFKMRCFVKKKNKRVFGEWTRVRTLKI